ncbi:PREDICTED: amino acid permease 5-like isoform X1 [Tarenaya hassleriana]|uniref:amino acid permease 5-like isoform X1 n=1 Tax=Tarenaya hassleriana TaxID=28532 RepID=UPI00053C4C35|nr:PREDICTED: amino acid permease 5-like isoform X1 [Tarenaya hassleriana]
MVGTVNGTQSFGVSMDVLPKNRSDLFDDDGRPKRTGTVWTASAHIITAVIGSGVLSLAWAVAQLGWVAGPAVMFLFSLVTYYTSILLCSCYRSGDSVSGKRNYTYMDAVQANLEPLKSIWARSSLNLFTQTEAKFESSHLGCCWDSQFEFQSVFGVNSGGVKVKLCGLVQYLNLFGTAIGYTIASAVSMIAIQRSNCHHKSHGKDPCHINGNPYMIAFGVAQIVFSQIPDFDRLWWLSIVAAVMSFMYSSIGLALGVSKVAENKEIKGSLTGIGVGTVTPSQKVWRSFQALGNIAFAYSYSMILIEIQDTLKSPPVEEKTMRKATLISVAVTTLFYMLCGCIGYAAFGDTSPGNLLSGGFFNPYWLIDIANLTIVIHLVGAYQVYCQPLFAFVENQASKRFPDSKLITKEIKIRLFPGREPYNLNLFRLVWRTLFVILTTLISMLMPFFNDVLGFLGAIGFWPLTVYFPVEMYIEHKRIQRWSTRWVCLQVLSFACLVVTLASAAGSVVGIVTDLKTYKPFKTDF